MLQGNIDICHDGVIEGWAWDPVLGDRPVLLAAYADGALIALELCAMHRADLAAAGIGAGGHGFRFVVPRNIWHGAAAIHLVSVLPGSALPGSPLTVGTDGRRAPSPVETRATVDIRALTASWNSSAEVGTLERLLLECDQRNLKLRQDLYRLAVERQSLVPTGGDAGSLERHIGAAALPRARAFLGDVFLFAPVDWTFRIQRYQHLAMRLADLGFRIVYLSPASINGPAGSQPFTIESTPHPDVYVVRLAPTGKPVDLAAGWIGDREVDAAVGALTHMIQQLRLARPICISAFPTWHHIVERLPKAMYLYDCADFHAGFDHVCASVSDAERLTLRSVDAATVSAGGLGDLLKQHLSGDAIHHIPNAADSDMLSIAPARSGNPRPRIGYVGAVESWLDTSLLCDAATRLPGYDFIVAGSGSAEPTLRRMAPANLTLLGEVPYADVPDLLATFDVGIIPFRIDDLTTYTDPIKVYEYLAAALPVAATDMPELEKFRDLVEFGGTGPAFADAIVRALGQSSTDHRDRRRRVASQHTWERRAVALAAVIERHLAPMTLVIASDTGRPLRHINRFAAAMNVAILLLVRNSTADDQHTLRRRGAASGTVTVHPATHYSDIITACAPRSTGTDHIVVLCDEATMDRIQDDPMAGLDRAVQAWRAHDRQARIVGVDDGLFGVSTWDDFAALGRPADEGEPTAFQSFARSLLQPDRTARRSVSRWSPAETAGISTV